MSESITNCNYICRLCLTASTQAMKSLNEETDIMTKIQVSLRLQIKMVDTLPESICNLCSDEVNRIFQFHQRASASQQILCQYSNAQELNKFYADLKCEVKQETDVSLYDKENKNNAFDFENKTEIQHNSMINVETTESNFDENFSLGEDNITEEKNIKTESNDMSVTNVSYNVPILGQIFKCLTCFKVFKTHGLLLNHYNEEHNKKSKHCNYSNSYETVKSIDGKTLFHCNICNKDYNSKKIVLRHMSFVHTNERPFLCKMCGRTYKTASDIIRHSRCHDGTKLFCREQCGYSTAYPGALKEHELRHNKTELKYKCEKCDRSFQVKTWYEQHQNIHTGVKPFVCDICGMAFHMDRYLTSHRTTVHPQSLKLKRYICVHCSLPCDSQISLTQHLKVHGIKANFLCDLCGKTLPNAARLKVHKQMHLGLRPFACSTCNKSFSRKFSLQSHERTHTGVKSHVCLPCGKGYSQKSTLQRHIMRHHNVPAEQKE